MANQPKVSPRPQHRGEEQKDLKQKQQKWIPLVGIVALLSVIIYFTWQETNSSGALSADEVADPALGPQRAAVEIVMYSDFGCPSCRAWHNAGIHQQVRAVFGDQVRFVWKDFPVITPLSPRAAEAAHCAGAQDKFWEYHDTIYRQHAGLEDRALRVYASTVGLEIAAFDQCLDQGLMRRKVQANDREARRLGLRGTPGFTLNGHLLPAPPSFDQLVVLIQQELAAQ